MQTLKITKIGNSRGIRIPAEVLRRYAFEDTALMVEGVDGILLRPSQADAKMSWAETAKNMAASGEDWSEWESASMDGLSDVPWEAENAVVKRGKTSRKKP